MIHDALKTYQILDEEYDLDNFWREHVPMLRQLSKLNLFAYGVSPGRFGGINSQLLESTGKVAWNLFVPTGMEIKDAGAAKEAQAVMRSLTPALNDITWMVDNLKEQGHVLFSQHHVTTAAEARKGYEAYNQMRDDFDAELKASGYSWSDLDRPWMAEAKMYYEAKKAELAERYPAWQKARTEDIYERQALEMEKDLRLQRASGVEGFAFNPTPDDRQLFEFEAYLAKLKDDARLAGYGTAEEDMSPEMWRAIRDKALTNLRQNPGWRAIWEKFYRRTYGPITVPATNDYLGMLGV